MEKRMTKKQRADALLEAALCWQNEMTRLERDKLDGEGYDLTAEFYNPGDDARSWAWNESASAALSEVEFFMGIEIE